jgi:hypothetical protein
MFILHLRAGPRHVGIPSMAKNLMHLVVVVVVDQGPEPRLRLHSSH